MGRHSTTGTQYLSVRDGVYYYQRDLPSAIASLVKGKIAVPWLTNPIELTGQVTIKKSLRTHLAEIASERFSHLHREVEAIIGTVAQVGSSDIPVSGLSAADIKIMADQAFYDVLARDEAALLGAGEATTSDVAVKFMIERYGPQGHTARESDVTRISQDLHYRRAKAFIADRNLKGFNQTNCEGEPADDQALLDEIKGPHFVGAKLSASANAALSKLSQQNEMPSPVELVLRANNITISTEHPDRRKLALALLVAETEARAAILKRRTGTWIETPPRPTLVKP